MLQAESLSPTGGWSPDLPPPLFKVHNNRLRSAKPTKDELEDYFRFLGATEENMDTGPGILVAGLKPSAGDTNVHTVPIKDTDLVARMWAGGMDFYSQFCLVFFDKRQQTPVNLPPGYTLYPASANMPGVFAMNGPLASWENAFGMSAEQIPAGEEKWSVPAGTYLSLYKDVQEVITFAVPATEAHRALMAQVVQPTFGYGS